MNELRAIVSQLSASDFTSGVLATLCTVSGSSYRRPGARLLLTREGKRLGSISGGCLEEDVISRAHCVQETGVAELVTYDTTSENDLVWGIGLGCHGVVQVLLEKISGPAAWATTLAENLAARRSTPLAIVWRAGDPAVLGTHLSPKLSELLTQPEAASVFFNTIDAPTSLLVFGAGDDAKPLARFASELGWDVTIADPRRDFVMRERFPTASKLLHAPAHELVSRLDPARDAIAVVMTHHYVHDKPLLRDLLARDLAYVGLLGPKKRAQRILTDLQNEGHRFSPEKLAHLHAPVGLDLGAETPEEVALSIVAEIKAALSGRNARPLREREQPIHG